MDGYDKHFWKPHLETDIYSNPVKKKPRKNKKKGEDAAYIYKYIRYHYGLHKYSIPAGIAYVINQELEDEMPQTKSGYKKYIVKQYHNIKDNRIERKGIKGDKDFYNSQAWREIRYIALAQCGSTCQVCGARASGSVQLHVDHIKPRSKYPKLSLDINNLQVLCKDCNLGKSNFDEINWKQHWESI